MKLLGIDSSMLVLNSMYAMHCLLWTFGDYYLFYLAKALAGPRCAVLTLLFSFCHEYIVKYCMRTFMNGVEGSLAIAALYYFLRLKSKMFDPSLSKMTALITLSFASRSSSLVPWIPLAVLKLIEDP